MTTIPPSKPVSASVAEMTQLVLPEHTNALGTLFGGTVMAWIDLCGSFSALRHARTMMVTASMDALHFVAPIKLGEIVTLKSSVNWVGRTSMEVGVRVTAENPVTGEIRHAASAWLTFVSVAADGTRPVLPGLIVETPDEIRRHADALARREHRLRTKRG